MGIFDAFKKKEEPKERIAEQVPITQAIQMKEKGLTNNQIIQILQQQGFNSQQIYDALAQAEARQSIEPYAQENEVPREELPAGAPLMQEPQAYPEQYPEETQETTAEQIIEEKWQKVAKELAKITEIKETVNTRMDRIEQQVKDVKEDLNSLHKAILSKVGEYDKKLTDFGTEILAMEKVFKEVLPEMTENLQELSILTKKFKGEKKVKEPEIKEEEPEEEIEVKEVEEKPVKEKETKLESLAKKK